MRIGLVCPYSFDAPGGVQNHVLGLARYLRDAGHQAEVLAPGEGRAETVAGLSVTSAGSAVPVRYNGSTARVNFGPLSAARVRRWLQQGTFDLVHIHEPITPSIALLALWASEAPVVATFHTATPRSRSMQLAGGALRASIEKIDAGIAVSESARRVVVQHLGRDAVVIPNGFDFAAFLRQASASASASASPKLVTDDKVDTIQPVVCDQFPPAGGNPAGGNPAGGNPAGGNPAGGSGAGGSGAGAGRRPRLAFVGRLDEPRKGLQVLLAALPMITELVGEVDVAVAGQGLRSLPPGCRALGAVDDPAKVRLLQGSDVFVAPHLARESFGIVLLEAMASGTAVVASDLPAFADLLQADTPAPLGAIFTTGDPAALAATVAHVLRHPQPDRLRRAQQVSRRYDWSVVGASILDVYRVTLAATRASGRAHSRVERTWAALDAALVRRARRAAEMAASPTIDPASALLVGEAAAAALAPGLDPAAREQAESDLSHVLAVVGVRGLEHEQAQAMLARRLHNDAVAVARTLRRRRVRLFGSTTPAAEPQPFEMADA